MIAGGNGRDKFQVGDHLGLSVLEHYQELISFIIAKGLKETQSPQTVPSGSFPQHCAYLQTKTEVR